MAESTIVYIKCPHCNGTGKSNIAGDLDKEGILRNCPKCQGEGYYVSGKIDTTDIMADLVVCKRKLKKLMDKLEVGD